jgi:hypothetical protein
MKKAVSQNTVFLGFHAEIKIPVFLNIMKNKAGVFYEHCSQRSGMTPSQTFHGKFPVYFAASRELEQSSRCFRPSLSVRQGLLSDMCLMMFRF